MTILLKNGDETKTIEGNCDIEFASTVMNQAEWLMEHMSDKNTDVTYQDIKTVVPTLSAAPDIRKIQSIIREDKDATNKFVAICNILAKARIFCITPCITVEI